MKKIQFGNNDQMPALGLGTWKSKAGEVYQAVKTAIKTGYRHIDCAPIYGNEKEVGKAISESIKEGIVTREELWITSKLWNNAHAKADVVPACKQTLSDLQLSYVDLYLIHWPVAFKSGISMPKNNEDMISLDDLPITTTWTGMEETVSLGLTKHIGVSNFGIKALEGLIANSKIKPSMNQVESHPYLQQDALLGFCQKNDIHLTAYSPLGSFDRSDAMKANNEPKLLADPIIAEIAKEKSVSPAQILISWALQRGISVIPKSVNPERIAQNIASEKIILNSTEIEKITALERGYRYVKGNVWVFENGPYTTESLWA